MTITEIKLEFEEIEELIFKNSLYKNLTLRELAEIFKTLIHLRNQFLSTSFLDMSLEELDDIRYKMMEIILNVRIEIREMVGLESELESEVMEELWSMGNLYIQII